MDIKLFIFNPIRVNTYVVWDNTNECIFVDAGCYSDKEKERLTAFVAENSLKPVALINTHGHFDHTAGNEFLCSRYGIDAYLHERDFYNIEKAAEHAMLFDMHLKKLPMPNFLPSSRIMSLLSVFGAVMPLSPPWGKSADSKSAAPLARLLRGSSRR